jgi:peptide/nickel transport system ATP-binding protein
MKELISVKGLTVRFYTYEGVVKALENVNFHINQQEVFGLVGETGCGKTMTALSLLRLIPSPGKIECGSIFMSPGNGNKPIDLLAIDENEMRGIRGTSIAMVFQEPSSALNPVYTIGNQIAEVILLHRQQEVAQRAMEAVTRTLAESSGFFGLLARPARLWQRRLLRARSNNPRSIGPRIVNRIPLARRSLWQLEATANAMAVESLKEVEIPDPARIAKQYPHQLSGGMKQRAVIAMALACCLRLLIADEPTTALDVTIQAQILELLRRLQNETGASILYITHDLGVAAQICNRVGVMYAGTLVEIANVYDLFANPLHPYTKALMAAVPKPGIKPQAIEGFVPDPLALPPGCRFHPRCGVAVDACREKSPPMREMASGHFVACDICQRENNENPR